MTMKQNKEKFDFKAFGQAIKAARKAKGISRNQLADTLNIAPRYIASIENSGQHPSLQILYELVTLLDVSVDQFFFPEREQEKSTRRRQLDTMLDTMSETDLKIMSATAKGIEEANNDETANGNAGVEATTSHAAPQRPQPRRSPLTNKLGKGTPSPPPVNGG